jgi:hypothetical protein
VTPVTRDSSGVVDRSRSEAAIVAVVVCVALYASSVVRTIAPGGFNDDAVYLALGRAIANGDGYRSIYLVGSPLHVKFPPGLPAILAVLWKLGGSLETVHTLAVGLNIVACSLAAAGLWWVARARLTLPTLLVAPLVMVPFLLDPATQYYTLVLSEPLFILAWVGVVLLGERVAGPTGRTPTLATAIALGLTLGVATLIRTQAVVLIPALVLALLLARTPVRLWITTTALAVLPLAAWRLYLGARTADSLATQASEQGYLTFAGGLGSTLSAIGAAAPTNVRDYAIMLADYVSPVRSIGLAIVVASTVLTCVGLVQLVRDGHRTLAFTVVANAIALVAWPSYQDRLVFPVLPVAGVAAAFALKRMASAVARRFSLDGLRAELVAVPVALVGMSVLTRQATIRHAGELARANGQASPVSSPSQWLPSNSGFVMSVAQWTLSSTQPNDRVALASAAGLWLYTGRKTVLTEFVEARGAPSAFDVPGRYLASRLVADSVNVVIVESGYSPIARDVVTVRAKCPSALTVVPGLQGQQFPAFLRATPGDACVRALDESLRNASPRHVTTAG